MERATQAVRDFAPGVANPQILTAVAISHWIIARTSMSCSGRMHAELLFDLKDSRIRGFLEAALPAIGANVAHLPADKPFFELSKEQIIDLLAAGIVGAQEAAVAAGESLGFPFDDEVPFG